MLLPKLTVIWRRRKNQSKRKVWKILWSMYKQKKYEIYWIKKIAELLKTDIRTFNTNIKFRIYEGQGKANAIKLWDDDIEIIKEVEKAIALLKTKTKEERKIAELVFSYLYYGD